MNEWTNDLFAKHRHGTEIIKAVWQEQKELSLIIKCMHRISLIYKFSLTCTHRDDAASYQEQLTAMLLCEFCLDDKWTQRIYSELLVARLRMSRLLVKIVNYHDR